MKFAFILLTLIYSNEVWAADFSQVKTDLTSKFQQANFKSWEGTYKGHIESRGQLGETEIQVTQCHSHGCSFEASVSFESTNEDLPAKERSCDYDGNFKFLSKDLAVAWTSEPAGEFTADLEDLNSKSKTFFQLKFERKGKSLQLDNSAAQNPSFCFRSGDPTPTAPKPAPRKLTRPSSSKAKRTSPAKPRAQLPAPAEKSSNP